jgi:hypothetical protein
MARKVLTVTIPHEGRDKGKVFIVTEMPATQAEKWAARAFFAIAKSDVEIPDDISGTGMAGIAALGIRAFGKMDFNDAEPLLDEMFQCIKIMPDPMKPEVVRGLIEDDIEEVRTRYELRKETIKLHINFSIPAVVQKLASQPAAGSGSLNT